MTHDELKPCPFCGGKAEMWRASESRTAWIACMAKCSVLVSKEYKTDEEAAAAWNTRAFESLIRADERAKENEACAARMEELSKEAEADFAKFNYTTDEHRISTFKKAAAAIRARMGGE